MVFRGISWYFMVSMVYFMVSMVYSPHFSVAKSHIFTTPVKRVARCLDPGPSALRSDSGAVLVARAFHPTMQLMGDWG